MKLLLFSVFDSAAGLFLEPFFAPTVEVAMRRFRMTLEVEGMMSKFPEDYTLFELGEFLLEDGQLVPLQAPHSLGLALAFMPAPSGPELDGEGVGITELRAAVGSGS